MKDCNGQLRMYVIWEVPHTLLLIRPCLSKTHILTLYLLIQNLRYFAVIVIPIYPFFYELIIVGNVVHMGMAGRPFEISAQKVAHNSFQTDRKIY